MCRVNVAEKLSNEKQDIMTSRTRNTKLFYKLVNKQRGSLKNNIDDLYVGDSRYSGTEGVLDGF